MTPRRPLPLLETSSPQHSGPMCRGRKGTPGGEGDNILATLCGVWRLGRPAGRGQACPTTEVSAYCEHRAWTAVSRNGGALPGAGAPDGPLGAHHGPRARGERLGGRLCGPQSHLGQSPSLKSSGGERGRCLKRRNLGSRGPADPWSSRELTVEGTVVPLFIGHLSPGPQGLPETPGTP